MSQTQSSDFFRELMCVRSIALGGQWEGVEARGGARLSPKTFPDPSHDALLLTHIGLQKKKSLDFDSLIGSSLTDITVQYPSKAKTMGNRFTFETIISLVSLPRVEFISLNSSITIPWLVIKK